MTYIINQTGIVLFVANKSVKIEKTDRRYPKIIECFSLDKSLQEDAVLKIITSVDEKVAALHGQDGFEIIDGSVWYKGEVLPPALSRKVHSIVRDNLPLDAFEKFWENLSENPSASSVDELMEFLEYKELPITEDGCFLAYKGITTDGWSIHGNTRTVVVEGVVDSLGRIKNSVGDRISVKRRDVDDNRANHCSFGLHVGSLSYAQSFGQKLVVVKVNPKDVVSVPTDYSCQKCRVSAYEVVSEYESEIESPITSDDGVALEEEYTEYRTEFIARLARYLENKTNSGVSQVTLRQIQNSFSPDYPSREKVMEALQELNYGWFEDDGVTIVELEDIDW
jgi:translation initiation factor IF-1